MGGHMTDEQFQLEFRRRAKSKVAFIDGTIPDPKEEGKKLHCSITGPIVAAREDFLYVVVPSGLILHDASYHVVLPDDSQFDMTSEAFSKLEVQGGRLSGFYVRQTYDVEYDVEQISVVEFGDDVSVFQEVYLYEFINSNLNITGGQVNHVGGIMFTHSCGATPSTENGAPVFDVDGRLVGISIANMQGPTNALQRCSFEKELNKIVNSKDLEHFIKLIYMSGWGCGQ